MSRSLTNTYASSFEGGCILRRKKSVPCGQTRPASSASQEMKKERSWSKHPTESPEPREFPCPLAEDYNWLERFQTTEEAKRHSRSMHKKDRKCGCPATFSSTQLEKRHVKSARKGRRYSCLFPSYAWALNVFLPRLSCGNAEANFSLLQKDRETHVVRGFELDVLSSRATRQNA